MFLTIRLSPISINKLYIFVKQINRKSIKEVQRLQLILIFVCTVTIVNNMFNVESVYDFLGIDFDETLWQCILHDLTLIVLGFSMVIMIKEGQRKNCCYVSKRSLFYMLLENNKIRRKRMEKKEENDTSAPLLLQLTDTTINSNISNNTNITVFNPDTTVAFKKIDT